MNRNLFNLFRILEVLWPCPANSVSAENRIGSKSYDGQQPGVLGIKKKKKIKAKTKLGLFPFLLLGRKETPRGLKICAVEMQREICS